MPPAIVGEAGPGGYMGKTAVALGRTVKVKPHQNPQALSAGSPVP